MNHVRRNFEKIEPALIVRLSMLLLLMFGALGATQAQWASPSPGITTTNDNVGIGTTTPSQKLDVVSNIQVSGQQDPGYWWTSNSSNSSARNWGAFTNHNVLGDWALKQSNALDGDPYAAGTTRFTIGPSGNVGIGTTAPGRLLSLSTATDGNGIEILTTTAAQSPTLRLTAGITNSSARNWAITTNDSAWGDFAIKYSTTQGGDAYAGTTAVTVRNGNVGIGTTSPGTKLDVNGTISATNVIAKFQDVAEWVPASEQLSAGTVVVLDSTKSNQVVSSSVSYDTRVAGVVSEQPGIALGEKSESKVLVATTGRVRVKVDASKGAIHIGDLLVTSDVPGMAMKSEPVEFAGRKMHMPGTLIGKALEPLEKGKGEILVLLSLQ